MRARSTWGIGCFLIAMFLSPTTLFAGIAAKVVFVSGSAVAVSASNERRELAKGASIEVGDTIITEDARLQLRFTDGGFVSLAPNSEFRIHAFFYSGTADGSERVAMELIKGGLRTISGVIGKVIKESYEMKTAFATIGIRGTEYSVVYGDSVSGTVSAGAIAVCNAAGCLDVLQGQSYHVTDWNIKPLLTSKTAFLPPPQPSKVDKKQATQTDIAKAPGKIRSLAKDTKPSVISDGGRRNADRQALHKGTRLSDGVRQKSLSLTFDGSMLKSTLAALKPDKHALEFETESFSGAAPERDDGNRNKERSLNPLEQLGVDAGAVSGNGKAK